jgi:hypothetical protein
VTATYNLINQIKAFNAASAQVDEMVALLTFAKSLRGTYTDSGLVVPEWLAEGIANIEQAIADARRDELLREAKLLDIEESRLKTKAERRDEVRARKEEINKLLGRSGAGANTPAPMTATVPAFDETKGEE